MRSVDDLDDGELKELKAEGWMIELVSLNSGYVYWGPYEDYMATRGDGWNAPIRTPSWSKFELTLDELNECVNFYFEASRASANCEACSRSGYNPETHEISETFYDSQGIFMGSPGHGSKRWCNDITVDEVQALIDGGRLHDFAKDFVKGEGWVNRDPPVVVDEELAHKVNEWNKKGMGHDGINRCILIKARAKRLGVYGLCPECEGDGYLYTEDKARLTLILWVLHPRKGCSRGWEVNDIQKDDVPAILAFLKEAADRNADRFQKVVEFGKAFSG